MKFIASTVLSCLVFAASISAQGFGPRQNLVSGSYGYICVCSADLDGDGDLDVIAINNWTDIVIWFENLGRGTFSSQQVITTAAIGAASVCTADLDQDGDLDILSSSHTSLTISWYENRLNDPNFLDIGPRQVIANNQYGVSMITANDLDGDGDADIAAVSHVHDRVFWIENLGGGSFGNIHTIQSSASAPVDIHTVDLEGDGDLDVLWCTRGTGEVHWKQNTGGGTFGPRLTIASGLSIVEEVCATDLDGDGDLDVLAASGFQTCCPYGWGKLTHYENLGNSTFGPEQVIADNPGLWPQYGEPFRAVQTGDLDGDGDADVIASENDGTISWYENDGNAVFGSKKTIDSGPLCLSLVAEDMDGDGDADILVGNHWGSVSWYENQSISYWGSGADLTLEVGVNAPLLSTPLLNHVSAGDATAIFLSSPLGSLNATPTILAGQMFPTGSTPIGPVLFPEVHIGTGVLAPFPPFVIYEGYLPPPGYSLAAVIPPGLTPISIMVQGFCLAPNPNNPYFTTTDAHEIQIQ